MNKEVLDLLLKYDFAVIADNEIVYLNSSINASYIFYQELRKTLIKLECQEVLSKDVSKINIDESTVFYQFNSLLHNDLFSFYGTYKSVEKARLNLFLLMELISEVTKSVFCIPLFSAEILNGKNEYILYTLISDRNTEFARFRIEQLNDRFNLNGYIDKNAFLALLTCRINSYDEMLLPDSLSPYTLIIDPIKPERPGIMEFARHLSSLFDKVDVRNKLIESSPTKTFRSKIKTPFRIRISKKEIRDKKATVIDNFTGESLIIPEDDLITMLKGLILNQMNNMYKVSLKKYLEASKPDSDNKVYETINWCGDPSCFEKLNQDVKGYYLPFRQNAKNKTCTICNNKAQKSVIVVKQSQ